MKAGWMNGWVDDDGGGGGSGGGHVAVCSYIVQTMCREE